MNELLVQLRDAWAWNGLDPKQVLAENEFGNLIIEDQAGRYWRLCPEEASCKVIAESREDLDLILNDEESLRDWRMEALVIPAIETLGNLVQGQKFCLKIPGVLGGPYTIDNIGKAPLSELIGFSGDLAYQAKDLPDGTQVELVIQNYPE